MKSKVVAIVISIFITLAVSVVGAAGQPPQASADSQGNSAQGQVVTVSPMTQVGSGFTYQGRLVISGSPASGNYDFTFTLFDAATGGNQVGDVVSLRDQPLSLGAFTAVLDFGSSAFQGDARWLQIAVRQSGQNSYTILSPRQAITPAPYAMSIMPGAAISGTVTFPGAMLTITDTGLGTNGLSIYSSGPALTAKTTASGYTAIAGRNDVSGGGTNIGVLGYAANGNSNSKGLYGIGWPGF